ncbi:nuclear transport factor 2 family protein [Pseudomonas sp. NPDC008258]|uniref:YybH family protein n=1 Tax=Pseudomonas sp. NPDC008258 TaxID=3364418 RepID=UPI0036EFF924
MSVAQTVQQLQARCQARDVDGVLKYFATDATISGEGAPGIVQGPESLRAAVVHMLELTPSLSIEIYLHQKISADSEVTWLHWSSPTPQGEVIAFRSLTTWRREGEAWQIAADFYGMGQFEG